jgi:hypothetical protein
MKKQKLQERIDRHKKTAEVVRRANAELSSAIDPLSLTMDLESVPDLDLDKLLKAPAFDFAHDIYGIIRHMDRTKFPGKLLNHFHPRCCASKK